MDVKNDIPECSGSKKQTEASQKIAGYSVIHEQVIAWGDMDAFNHVNNVIYYRYAESARITYLHQMGMFASNNILMLAQSSCTYLRPVFFPDVLQIGVRCKKLGNTSMVFEYVFLSTEQQAIVATAEAVIVQMTADASAKKPWTTEQRKKIEQLEQKADYIPER